MKRHGNWVIKVILVLLATLWLSVVAASWSEAAEDGVNADDEYNFSWLDPEKKIYVLQNRRYTKANKLLLSLGGGLAKTSPYRSSYQVDPRVAYYFSENWGFEVAYQIFSNGTNNNFKALSSTGVSPNILEVKNQLAALLHWAPWYAKINVFNSILYFDWYFTGGVGTVSTNAIAGANGTTPNVGTAGNKSYTGLFFGTGHQYHVSERFVVRLDYTNVWFKAPERAISGANTNYTNSTFTVGVGLRL
jgi:outer membrane beta-barrel protein